MRRIALFAVPFLFASCHKEAPKAAKAPAPVQVAAVEMFTPAGGERYSASLLPARQVTLAFKTSGFVEAIHHVHGHAVDIGDMVAQGTLLARVRAKDYQFQVDQAAGQWNQARQSEQAARAQLQQAEAAAAKASLDYERAAALFGDKAVTKADYDAAKAQLDSTRAQVEAARSQIAAYTASVQTAQAALGTATLGLHDTSLAAPFSAALVQRNVEVGSLASPGAAAFTLADIGTVKASFGVPDVVVVHLKTGGELTIFAEALPDRQFKGVVTAIAAVADSSTRLFQVQVTIPNPQHVLKPGMIANLELGAAAKSAPLPVVPLSAIVRPKEGESGFAVIVVEGKQARRRAVKLGATFGDRIAVGGVNPGDRVISSGASLIADGEVVEVVL